MTFERDGIVLERNKRLEWIFWGLAGLLTIGGAAQLLFMRGAPFLFYALSLPLGLAARTSNENWRARPRNARVRASREGVTVDGVTVAHAAEISVAVVQPRVGKKPTVRLRHHKRGVIFEMIVENEEEGVDFLRAIGHDASAKKARFSTLSPALATQLRRVLLLVALMGVMFTIPFALAKVSLAALAIATVAAVVPFVFAMRKQDVDVGADGLTLSWNRRRRFIPWDDVRAIAPAGKDSVSVTTTSGENIPLRTSAGGGFDTKERNARLRDALLRRITEAVEAHRSRIGPRELAALLMPKARTETWLTDLRKLREGEGGYRAAAVREDDLWRVVEDPGAPEEARAAAAMLVRNTDGAGARLRIAADAVASPKLRGAFEAEEEEETEEALKAYLR